jgi:Putative beta-barrel porin 2
MKKHTLTSCALLVVAGAVATPALAATVARQPDDPFTLSLSEQVTRDPNVYRLPDDLPLGIVLPSADASRDDLVSRTSAVIDGNLDLGKQAFALNVGIDSNRYADNTMLNNTSGSGRADWNWQLLSDWSGQLGASYGRSLAGFVNSRFLGRDVLESSDYHGVIRYELTPHWSLIAKGTYAEGTHDTDARRTDDFKRDTSVFAIDYLTRRGDQMGFQYRRTATDYPTPQLGSGLFSDRDYVERAGTYELHYAFTVKTSFQGSVGYLWRHYPRSVIGDFAGPVWNATLQWQPRAKIQMELTQFQELTAYLDAESNHFESRGTRLTMAWRPTSKITLSLEGSREHHAYTGFDPFDSAAPERRDRLGIWQAGVSYTPVQMLALNVNYRFERRATNRPLYGYDDRVISAGLTLIF